MAMAICLGREWKGLWGNSLARFLFAPGAVKLDTFPRSTFQDLFQGPGGRGIYYRDHGRFQCVPQLVDSLVYCGELLNPSPPFWSRPGDQKT